ncbi:MAG: dihydroxyacetone kinase phosphoryl donor subunit DhaM [Bacillota bacterium]
MVGILIVSHSIELATGTKKLAEQMIQDEIILEAVGGTADGRLGTSSDLIYEKLEQMDKEDGIIVLADMGSAVMNVELAFELFAEEVQEKLVIANAPIVEGAVCAVVEASFNKSIDEILEAIKKEEFSIKVSE